MLNSKVKTELDNMATFFKLALAYKNKIGFKGQFLIEPKPKEPSKHQYDYDAMTVIGFLRTYGLEEHFKLNIEPNHTQLAGHDFEHDLMISSEFEMLGSVDSNTGEPSLGWDVDCFPMNHKETTMAMYYIMKQGGLAPGGLNFDCKVRRESTDLEDMFIATIASMDCWAKGLLTAVDIADEGKFDGMLENRYKTWKSYQGQEVESGRSSFQALDQLARRNVEPPLTSGKQELFEQTFNSHIWQMDSKL